MVALAITPFFVFGIWSSFNISFRPNESEPPLYFGLAKVKGIQGLVYQPRRPEMFRELSVEEEESFREWAHENFKIDQEPNELWHPVIRWEWAKIKNNHLNI